MDTSSEGTEVQPTSPTSLNRQTSNLPEFGRRHASRHANSVSFPEIVDFALTTRKREETDDILRVVDHCLLKLADMESVLSECHAACSSGPGLVPLSHWESDSSAVEEESDDADAHGTSERAAPFAAQEAPGGDAQPPPRDTRTSKSTKLFSERHPEDIPPVKKKYIKQFLKKELREADAFLAMPFVVVMFAAFCLGTIGSTSHFRTEELHSQDHAISFDIEENANFAFTGSFPFEHGRMGFKNIHDVNSVGDFWSWLNLGLLPLFFPERGTWDVSESRVNVAAHCQSFKSSLQAAAWPESSLAGTKDATNMHGTFLRPGGVQCPEGGDGPERPKSVYGEEQVAPYLFHNEIVVGMRMQQEYTPEVKCPDSAERFRGELFGGECLDFGPYKLQPELSTILQGDRELLDHPNGRTVYLPTRTPLTTLLNITRQLENEVWFSPKTRKINLLYTTYNPSYNTMTGTFLFFVLTRSGHIFKVVEPITVVMDAYPTWGSYVPDLVWFLCIVKLGAAEFIEISQFWREFGAWEGTARYASPLNLIDWLNVCYALVIVILWGLQISAINGLHTMLLLANPDTPGSFGSEAAMGAYFDQVESVCLGQTSLRRILAFYPLVIISGFMKPFSAQPRLGVMTRTLSAAAVDIAHFFFVFSVVFGMYSIMGMVLFGEELVEFATLPRAITSTFHCLLGNLVGQEQLPDDEFPMARAGQLEAALWLWSFCWIINLIMLNMLLAIVMDTYASVVSNMPADAETLTSQAAEIATRLWHQVKWKYAPLEKILSVVDPITLDDGPEKDDDDDVDVPTLIRDCDDRNLSLPTAQAIDLIEKSALLASLVGGQSTSETTRTVRIVEMEIKALLQIVEANNALLSARDDPFAGDEPDNEESGGTKANNALLSARDDPFTGDEPDEAGSDGTKGDSAAEDGESPRVAI